MVALLRQKRLRWIGYALRRDATDRSKFENQLANKDGVSLQDTADIV